MVGERGMLGCSGVTGSSGNETTRTLEADTGGRTPQNSERGWKPQASQGGARDVFLLGFFLLLLFFFILIFSFTYFCVGSLLLHGLFSSSGERELLFAVVHGLLIAAASLVAGHRLAGVRVSAAVAHGLRSRGSRL